MDRHDSFLNMFHLSPLELSDTAKDLEMGKLPDDGRKKKDEKADFERAIELTGYGKFHYLLLMVCGFVSTAEEMDVISMSFVMPPATCELELNTLTKGWLNSIIFIGMIVGSCTWGPVADSLGRKNVLLMSSFFNAIFNIGFSVSPTYEVLLLLKFLNGVALGCSGPVIWSYFAEFQPRDKRGFMLSFMAAFWTLGNLLVAGLAWIIIPNPNLTFKGGLVNFSSWRFFLLICSLPSVIMACLIYFLPESPKFLVSQGRSIHRYPVKQLILYDNSQADQEDTSPRAGKIITTIRKVIRNSKQLFIRPVLKVTIICIVVSLTFHVGYYGLMMWLPELFTRFDKFANKFGERDASICTVTFFVNKDDTLNNTQQCEADIPDTVFLDTFITVAAAVPSNVIAILGMDRFGRKLILVISTILSGLCAGSMYFVINKTQNVIASAIFSSLISCGNVAFDCLVTEIFPTNVRATGIAITMVAARLGGIIGNIVIASLLDTYCPAPTYIVAAVLICGNLISVFLPNTTGQPLP